MPVAYRDESLVSAIFLAYARQIGMGRIDDLSVRNPLSHGRFRLGFSGPGKLCGRQILGMERLNPLLDRFQVFSRGSRLPIVRRHGIGRVIQSNPNA